MTLRTASLGDLNDPSCPNGCRTDVARAIGWATGLNLVTDCTPCSCSSNQLWNPATRSCQANPAALPDPTAPSVTVVQAGTPGSILGGYNSNGNPVYLLESTPQADQAATIANIAGSLPTPDTNGDIPDCTTWYSVFNSQCPTDCSAWYNTLNAACGGSGLAPLFIGAAALVGVLFVLPAISGGKR